MISPAIILPNGPQTGACGDAGWECAHAAQSHVTHVQVVIRRLPPKLPEAVLQQAMGAHVQHVTSFSFQLGDETCVVVVWVDIVHDSYANAIDQRLSLWV